MSYTSFEYDDLKTQTNGNKATITFTLKNTGKVAGAEVAQVYLHQEKSLLPRPEKELKGFQKVYLKPGEKKSVTIQLDASAFQYYNDVESKWVMEPGAFDVLVGGSSRDIKLNGTIYMSK